MVKLIKLQFATYKLNKILNRLSYNPIISQNQSFDSDECDQQNRIIKY